MRENHKLGENCHYEINLDSPSCSLSECFLLRGYTYIGTIEGCSIEAEENEENGAINCNVITCD